MNEFQKNLSIEHYNRIQWTVSNMTYPSSSNQIEFGYNVPKKYLVDIQHRRPK